GRRARVRPLRGRLPRDRERDGRRRLFGDPEEHHRAAAPGSSPELLSHPLNTPPAPLAGITVLDLSTVGPGTRCTRILADYGAAVVKVGVPPKKAALQTQPAFWTYSANRGMQQVRIDLKDEGGKVAFIALAKRADVVVESYRPGVMARLGLGYDALRAVNP